MAYKCVYIAKNDKYEMIIIDTDVCNCERVIITLAHHIAEVIFLYNMQQ